MYSGERKGRGKASPTVIDQDLLSHKVPTLQRFTNVFQTICCITQQERTTYMNFVDHHWVGCSAIFCALYVSCTLYRMVGGHWVGCIIGRQFRQLALPQARKQKTPPHSLLKSLFSLSFLTLKILQRNRPPLSSWAVFLSIIAIIAIIEVHLLQNYLQIYQKPKTAAVISQDFMFFALFQACANFRMWRWTNRPRWRERTNCLATLVFNSAITKNTSCF